MSAASPSPHCRAAIPQRGSAPHYRNALPHQSNAGRYRATVPQLTTALVGAPHHRDAAVVRGTA
jgi:hypothetical protein